MQNYRLFNGLPCGTNSKNIYEDYAEKFGWDKRQANQFGKRGLPLYARNATPEGYNMWFIGHSNLTATKGGDWDNEILYGGEKINEYWKKIDNKADFYDMTHRVVFAKKKDGYYYFLGIYEVSEKPDLTKQIEHNGKYVWVRRYRRICENYPISK